MSNLSSELIIIDNKEDRKVMKALVMAPMVPCPEHEQIHADFVHHLRNTKEIYDPSRRITLTAPREVWGASNAEVQRIYSHYTFDPSKGQIDETYQKWILSSKDDKRGGARRFIQHYLFKLNY